jgi:NADH-quinone oxidoreductase subunit K
LLFHDFPAALRSHIGAGLIAIMGAVVLASNPGTKPPGEEGGLMVPLSYYLVLSGILFACGVTGFLIKRNIITIFMSIELMLNGVNLSFVAFAAQWHALSGQVFVFFVMVVAAAEAAVGLAIIIAVYRTRETLNVDRVL